MKQDVDGIVHEHLRNKEKTLELKDRWRWRHRQRDALRSAISSGAMQEELRAGSRGGMLRDRMPICMVGATRRKGDLRAGYCI